MAAPPFPRTPARSPFNLSFVSANRFLSTAQSGSTPVSMPLLRLVPGLGLPVPYHHTVLKGHAETLH